MIDRQVNVRKGGCIEIEEEPCCESPNVFLAENGEFVCKSCGTCFGPAIIQREKRAYTMEEIEERKHTEPVQYWFGTRTVIPRPTTDSKGNKIGSKKAYLFRRLIKINSSLVTSVERNHWEARPKLKKMASTLEIPNYITSTAWKVYKRCVEMKLTMGRSISSFVSASLYAAIRVHNFPRMIDEVMELAEPGPKTTRKMLVIVIRDVLPSLGMKYRPVDPRSLVYRYGNEMNMSIKTQQDASAIITTAMKDGMVIAGKDPKGVVAASMYLAAIINKDRRTQRDIADVCRVTEVTLRTRAKQLKKKMTFFDA